MESLVRVGSELATIASELSQATEAHEITVRSILGKASVKTSFNPVYYVEEAVTYWSAFFGLKDGQDKTDTKTCDYFKEIFGEKRVERILGDVTCFAAFTKKHIRELFSYAGEVQIQDIEELFQEIKTKNPKIRFLTENETEQVRAQFRDCSKLHECMSRHFDTMMAILLPFNQISDLFLKNVPSLDSVNFNCPRSKASLQKRVLVYEMIKREKITEDQWIMLLAKTLSDREIPEGTILKGPFNSYMTVFKIVSAGGAYKYFLKTISQDTKQGGNYILYRGTSPFPSATGSFETLLEDLRFNLGENGPKKTFEKTQSLLTDPSLGFVEKKDEKITAIGMSLGGAHAMRDAQHFAFSRLITVASPGIDKKSCEQFAEAINHGKKKPPVIEHHFEAEDVLDQFGEQHLGAGCEKDKLTVKIKIHKPLKNNEKLEFQDIKEELSVCAKLRQVFTTYAWQKLIPEPIVSIVKWVKVPSWIFSLPDASLKLIQTIFDVHVRNTLLGRCKTIEINNQEFQNHVQSILDHTSQLCDRRWEKIRKMVAYPLSKL